jgi:hypothetical protein
LPRQLAQSDDTVVIAGATAAMVVAANADQLRGPVAVWLSVTNDYSSPIAARDAGTLSWLVSLHDVVVSAETGDVVDHATVISRLLCEDDVTYSSASVCVTSAYNRPLPPAPINVWAADGSPTMDEVQLRLIRAARGGDIAIGATELSKLIE